MFSKNILLNQIKNIMEAYTFHVIVRSTLQNRPQVLNNHFAREDFDFAPALALVYGLDQDGMAMVMNREQRNGK